MPRLITRVINPETGIVIIEEHRTDGQLHRQPDEGPAYTFFDINTGDLISERYYWRGRLHRPDGPAWLDYLRDVVTKEIYYHRGTQHREPSEGPALIERSKDGEVLTLEAYIVHGQLYRDPTHGPYETSRYENGQLEFENYCDASNLRPLARPSRRKSLTSISKKPSP